MRTRRALLPLAALIGVAACNAVLGNEDRYYLAADACVLNSECDDGEVCIFRLCSPPCREGVDCPPAPRGLRAADVAGEVGAVGAVGAHDVVVEQVGGRPRRPRERHPVGADLGHDQAARLDVATALQVR